MALLSRGGVRCPARASLVSCAQLVRCCCVANTTRVDSSGFEPGLGQSAALVDKDSDQDHSEKEGRKFPRGRGGKDRAERRVFSDKIAGMPSVADLMRQYNVRASQKLSQNFLTDSNACRVLARAAGPLRGAHVCEVGPGMGNITRHILSDAPAAVTLVERDARFMPGLLALRDYVQEHLHVPMHLVAGDILRYDVDLAFGGKRGDEEEDSATSSRTLPCFPVLPSRDWSEPVKDAAIVGNLPFNVSIPLLIGWLRDIASRASVWRRARVPLALTFQHEVGERMVASPGDRERRCRLSVMVQTFCHVRYKHRIPGHLFVPRPEVDVAVMQLVPRVEPLLDMTRHSFDRFERVIRAIFNTRAKFLLRAVGNLYPKAVRQKLASDTLRMAGLDPGSVLGAATSRRQSNNSKFELCGSTPRPFLCSNEELVRICDAYSGICELHPGLEGYDFRAPDPAGREAVWREDEALMNIVAD